MRTGMSNTNRGDQTLSSAFGETPSKNLTGVTSIQKLISQNNEYFRKSETKKLI